ncbi:MAG: S41 family peptidase [Oscillospiraceae bacterium]|nr:S41 family peptidase [Oscillospiraceae bacterium]
MNKKISVKVSIILILLSVILTTFVSIIISMNIFNLKINNITLKESTYNKISEVYNAIEEYYVGDIKEEDIIEGAARGMIDSLGDKYSNYMDESEVENYMKSSDGVLVGIGVTAKENTVNGGIEIISVFEGSPAFDAGIKREDIIVSVNGEDITPNKFEDNIKKIRGEIGSEVKLKFIRDNQEIDINIIRRSITVESINHKMIGDIGYIKISEFNNSTTQQFKNALKEIDMQKGKGIIFDVRDNPGGTLKSVSAMVDMIVPEGPIIIAEYKGGKTEVLNVSDKNEINIPMVIITNGNSASASELFTGALRDYDKAIVVGEKTFGKGIMQSLIPLSKKTGVNLTTAYFNPPKSPNFHGIGIEPDFYISMSEDIKSRFPDISEQEDTQLQKAIEVMNTLK